MAIAIPFVFGQPLQKPMLKMQSFFSLSKCGCLCYICISPLLPGFKAEVTKCYEKDNLPDCQCESKPEVLTSFQERLLSSNHGYIFADARGLTKHPYFWMIIKIEP
jgi:hypothetical protein